MSPTAWQVYHLKERMDALEQKVEELEQKVEELEQRKWVGLTDEQREACTQSPFTEDNYQDIEDKLKELNT